MCDQEAEEFRDLEALMTLQDIAKAHDKLLADALARLVGQGVSNDINYLPRHNVVEANNSAYDS